VRKKKIELVEVERVWEEQSGYLKVKKQKLVEAGFEFVTDMNDCKLFRKPK
jgi:hypothetical protein